MTTVLAAVASLLLAGMALADEAGTPEALLTALHNATVQGDCARAAELVRALEGGGDAQALAILGGRFEEGRRCLGQDPARAAKLYRRAAEEGEAVAMVRLGRLYAEGRGVPKDFAKARYRFRAGVLAVVAIDAEVRARALRMALADGAVPDLLAQQLTWLSLIERGGPASEFDLALRMRAGDGVPQNEAAAERLMGKLAAEEYPPALYQFGLWLLAKAESDEDRRWAFRQIQSAANRGHLPAMLDLAQRMMEGRGVERDDYWACIAFWIARERGADVDTQLAILEERLGFFRFREARDYAQGRDDFPIVMVKSRSTRSRAGFVPPRTPRFPSAGSRYGE